MEPLRIAIEMTQLEKVLNLLELALNPRVSFSDDLEQMRRMAQEESFRHVVAARDLLKAQING